MRQSSADEIFGPVSTDGAYNDARSKFDGPIGFIDGIAGITQSAGNIASGVANIKESNARGNSATDNARLDRQERELAMQNSRLKVKRGDNVQLYYAGGAVALALILILK